MPLPLRTLLVPVAALTLATAALNAPAQAARPSPGSAHRPQLLDHPARGHAAVAALGDRLATAAAGNEMSSAKLASVLSHDPSAWVARDGSLYYVDEAATRTEAATSTTSAMLTAPFSLSQTFALHSLPGSTHTIYLDFDGYTLPSTSFWVAQSSMKAGTFGGWSLDSSASFSSTEQAYIQNVWRMVAEKFAPFDVDVTTQDPGTAAYNRSGSADQTYGDHVVFTDSPAAVNQACGGNCSGIAVVGGFDSASDSSSGLEPAWVFTSKTWDKAALTAHTAAHEVGHTLGLNHDGVIGGSSYYEGQGNWFPIMGSGVNAVGQWSNGDYASANNLQDDLAVIASNASPSMLRADDHGDSTLSATDLGTYSSYVANGVIGTRTDQDVYEVTRACTGDITATATGIGEAQSVDLRVKVLSPLGLTLATDDPASGQDGSWPHLPSGLNAGTKVSGASAGTYYVTVDGVGRGSALSTGYSDYGSVGVYRLTISGCPDAPAQPTPPTIVPTSNPVTVARAPSAPRIGRAASGRAGRPVNAVARWAAPASNGGATITGYRVRALRIGSAGRVTRTSTSRVLGTATRRYTMKLPAGRYRFQVIAINRAGSSAGSRLSGVVRAR